MTRGELIEYTWFHINCYRIIFLIHSVIYINKIGINRSNKFIIVNKQKLLNLQLCCSILNSACMIILGVVVIRYNLPNIYM